MRPSPFSRYLLPLLSALVLFGALSLWGVRRTRVDEGQFERTQRIEKLLVQKLLESTRYADSNRVYSANSTVSAMYGNQTMKAVAHMVRAPRRLSITYLDGHSKGLKSGYNEKWFWRQSNTNSPLEAYAEVEFRPDEMAERRFALMMKNYRGRLLNPEKVSGRDAEVIQLEPAYPIDKAVGPMKRVWIDRKSNITLRIDTYNHQGKIVMKSIVSDLNLSPKIESTTFVPPQQMMNAASVKRWMASEMGNHAEKVAQETGIVPVKPSYVPPGFEYDNVGVHRCNDNGTPIVAALTRYTDGINVLTIFAMPSKTPKNQAVVQSPKPTGAAIGNQKCDFGSGTMVMRPDPNGRLIAVADLPAKTLEKVLNYTKIELAKQGTQPKN